MYAVFPLLGHSTDIVEFPRRYRARMPGLIAVIHLSIYKTVSPKLAKRISNHSTSVFGMASSDSAATVTPPSEIVSDIYVVFYYPRYWYNQVFFLNGGKPVEENWGSLSAYRSLSQAQESGKAWLEEQLLHCLDSDALPGESDQEREPAKDEWTKSEGDSWLYWMRKGDQKLFTKVQKMVLYDDPQVFISASQSPTLANESWYDSSSS